MLSKQMINILIWVLGQVNFQNHLWATSSGTKVRTIVTKVKVATW